MKVNLIRVLCCLCFSLPALMPEAFGQSARHVVLISIDGFRPDFYQDDAWSAPNLRKVMEQGVHAVGVHSVVPSVTYPSHTSIVTGALPGRHGIYYNLPRDSTQGQWYWEESYIKTPTLWDAVKKSGLTSAAIFWPVTAGAPIDYNFPVRRPNRDEPGDQLSVTRPLVTPPTLLEEIEKACGLKVNKAALMHDNLDKTIATMANYLLSGHRPNLLAVHFLSMDHAGHAVGREGPQIRDALALVDSLVGTLLTTLEVAGMKDSTAVIITGDHGMVTRTQALAPNVWLAENGLLGADEWSAEFHPAGGSAFLYLRDRSDTTTLNKVRQILANVTPAEKRLFRVVTRSELDAVGANPEPVLALAFSKGVVFHPATDGKVLRPVKRGGAHGYFPDFQEIMTGFIAAGVGINDHGEVPEMGIADIAPLVAALLGIDFSAPDGKLPSGILAVDAEIKN